MDSAKNVRWIIPFKKFGMVRVKTLSFNVKRNFLLFSMDQIFSDIYKI